MAVMEAIRVSSSSLPLRRLVHKCVYGSTGSPRTDHSPLEISYLAVRPELVEG